MVFLDAATMGPVSLEPIAALGELILYPTSTTEQAMERVREADVIITNKVVIDESVISSAPRLRLICVTATGTNNIDFAAAERHGVMVKNVKGYSTESVLQITFMHILSLLCCPEKYDHEVKDFSYSRSGVANDVSHPFMELSGKTMGIIGMGNIGQRVAEVACAFGMKVIYYSTSGTSHCSAYPSVSLEELLRTSDVVSIHAPMNERTNGLVGAKELAWMKPTGIIVNMGRGGIVDESALADAIDRAAIGGAALDVYSTEPVPEDNPLLHTSHPELLRFTPHLAWAAAESLDRLIAKVADNIKTTDIFN